MRNAARSAYMDGLINYQFYKALVKRELNVVVLPCAEEAKTIESLQLTVDFLRKQVENLEADNEFLQKELDYAYKDRGK